MCKVKKKKDRTKRIMNLKFGGISLYFFFWKYWGTFFSEPCIACLFAGYLSLLKLYPICFLKPIFYFNHGGTSSTKSLGRYKIHLQRGNCEISSGGKNFEYLGTIKNVRCGVGVCVGCVCFKGWGEGKIVKNKRLRSFKNPLVQCDFRSEI